MGSLLIIDDQQVRSATFAPLESILAEIEALESDYQAFLERDQDDFRIWLQESMGAECADIEALEQKVWQENLAYTSLLALAKRERMSLAQALTFFRLEEAWLRHASKRERTRIEAERKRRERAAEKILSREPEADLCSLAEAFEVSIDNEGIGDLELQELEFAARLEASLARIASQHINFVYRKLARLLHPDRQDPSRPQKYWERNLWNRTQEAYNVGDPGELWRLHQLFLVRNRRLTELTLAEISDAQIWLEAERKQLLEETDPFRHSPAWGFHRCRNRETLRGALLEQFDGERARLENQLSELSLKKARLEWVATKRPLRLARYWRRSKRLFANRPIASERKTVEHKNALSTPLSSVDILARRGDRPRSAVRRIENTPERATREATTYSNNETDHDSAWTCSVGILARRGDRPRSAVRRIENTPERATREATKYSEDANRATPLQYSFPF